MAHILLLTRREGVTECLFSSGEIQILRITPEEILSCMCMRHGSSLRGRLDAVSALTEYRQKLPVLISESSQVIYFPTGGSRNRRSAYIRYNDIIGLVKTDDPGVTEILFSTGVRAFVHASGRTIRLQMQRCEKYLQILQNSCAAGETETLLKFMGEKQ